MRFKFVVLHMNIIFERRALICVCVCVGGVDVYPYMWCRNGQIWRDMLEGMFEKMCTCIGKKVSNYFRALPGTLQKRGCPRS